MRETFFYKLEDIIVIYSGRTIKELESLELENKELVVGIDKDTVELMTRNMLGWPEHFIRAIALPIFDNAKTIKADADILPVFQSFLESVVGHENILKYKNKIVGLFPKEPFRYYTVEEINAMMRSMPHPEDNCMEENSDKDYSVNEE